MHNQSLTYIHSSSNAACEILELLPKSDLLDELRNLVSTTAYISNLMLINKPISDSECEELTLYAKEVELEALRIKHATNQKQV